jgi:hypothetical protein
MYVKVKRIYLNRQNLYEETKNIRNRTYIVNTAASYSKESIDN